MKDFYKPFNERTPDTQYSDRLSQILEKGRLAEKTPQGVGAITCFGTLPKMIFDLSNGIPLITERKIGFWRKAIAEIIAFINGARTVDQIASYGCDFWAAYNKDAGIGLAPGDMGPGSYGPAFHDYPMPDGTGFNQFESLVEQIAKYPHMRTHRVISWIPYYTPRGPRRKVDVAPCHGDLYVNILEGKLDMMMVQRSADMPIGVPSNMLEYAALQLMLCQVTGYPPGVFIHDFVNAHIYEDQVDRVRELLTRESRPFPTLRLDPDVKNLFDFRPEHFTLEDYDPQPPIQFPYRP
jgi:thymidylate synthase